MRKLLWRRPSLGHTPVTFISQMMALRRQTAERGVVVNGNQSGSRDVLWKPRLHVIRAKDLRVWWEVDNTRKKKNGLPNESWLHQCHAWSWCTTNQTGVTCSLPSLPPGHWAALLTDLRFSKEQSRTWESTQTHRRERAIGKSLTLVFCGRLLSWLLHKPVWCSCSACTRKQVGIGYDVQW